MLRRARCLPLVLSLSLLVAVLGLSPSGALSQSRLKKIRLEVAATSVGFLPIYAAYHLRQ